MRRFLKKVVLALGLGFLAGVVTLPQIFPLPFLPPYLVAPIVSFLSFVCYPLADDIYHKITGKEQKSERILKHYNNLRDEVFAVIRDSEAVRTKTNIGLFGISSQAYFPLFYDFDKWPDSGSDNYIRAMSHLRNKKYQYEMQNWVIFQKGFHKHNDQVSTIIEDVESDVSNLLIEYPMVREKSESTPDYCFSSAIKMAIQSRWNVIVRDSDICYEAETLAHITNPLIRDLFLGKIRLLVKKYSQRIDQLEHEADGVPTSFSIVKQWMTVIIKGIDDFQRLEGECDIEKGGGPLQVGMRSAVLDN